MYKSVVGNVSYKVALLDTIPVSFQLFVEITLFEPPMPDWHLAEVNIARLKAPIGDPIVAPFVNALDKINSIADRMDGFVWRHIDDTGNVTNTQISSDECVIYKASI